MKFTCLQEDFAKALATVGRAIAAKPTWGAGGSVLLEAAGGSLKLTATDLTMVLTTKIDVTVHEDGAVCLPAKLLGEYIRSLPAGEIELKRTAKPVGAFVKASGDEANISGIAAEDFPPLPAVGVAFGFDVDPQALSDGIRRVAIAAASNGDRPALHGVNFEVEGKDITLAASDGFRLAVFKEKLAKAATETLRFVLPVRGVVEMERLLAGQTEPVELQYSEANRVVYMKAGAVEMTCSLVGGNFPDYGKLIPKAFQSRVVLGSDEFRRAARLSAVIARESDGILRLNVTPGEGEGAGCLSLAVESEGAGDNEGRLEAMVEGEKNRIAFNAKYLIDVLSAVKGDVSLEVVSPTHPGMFKAVDDDRYLHVVMPMFVQS